MKRNAKTTDDGYNGWTNYETWNAALWMNNDEYTQSYWDERAGEVAEEAENDDAATDALADMLAAQLLEDAPDVGGFYGDVLRAAIRSVNTHEIADGLLEEYRREALRERARNNEHSEIEHDASNEQEGPYR